MSSDILENLVLSASSLKTFKQCGRKFHLYKVLKAQPSHEPFHYGWVGTLVHNCAYYSIADYLDGEWNVTGPKSWSAVESFFEDLWEGKIEYQVSRHLVEDGEASADKPLFKPGSMNERKYVNPKLTEEQQWKVMAKDLALKAYSLMTKNILGSYAKVELEHKLQFKFDGRVETVGYVDILCTTETGRMHFYDLKTSKRPPRYLDNDIQFYLYRYGLKETFDLNYYPEGHYVHLRSGKVLPAATTSHEVLTKSYDEIHTLIDGVASENWEPNLYQVLCGFCEFRGFCYGDDGQYIDGKLESVLKTMENTNDEGKIPLTVI